MELLIMPSYGKKKKPMPRPKKVGKKMPRKYGKK